MSAGERYGISTHLADPEPVCPLGRCDGTGWFWSRDELVYHDDDEFCARSSRYGGCPGHEAERRCPCREAQ